MASLVEVSTNLETSILHTDFLTIVVNGGSEN